MSEPENSATGKLPMQFSQSKTAGREYAAKMARTIFSRYPNTDRAPPEYLAEMINCLAEQPKRIIDRVADRHLGITSKHPTFLPTVGQIVDMITALHEQEARAERYGTLRSRFSSVEPKPFQRAIPFPKLWAAFAEEPEALEALNTAGSFSMLFDASKLLATRGKDAARSVLGCEAPIINNPAKTSEAA